MFRNMKISYRLAGGIVLLLAVTVGLMLPFVLAQLNSVIERAEVRQLGDLHKSLQARVIDISEEALLVIDAVANQPGVAESFASGDRNRLQELTLPVFLSLQKNYNVKQFQFHLPPATSFLRLHKVEKFGDDLSSFRHTVVRTNQLKRAQYGLESGVAGIGLRGVMPVTYSGQHVGSAEMGLSFGQDFFDAFSSRYDAPAALHLSGKTAGGNFATYASSIPKNTTLNNAEFEKALAGEVIHKVHEVSGIKYSVMAKPLLDFTNQTLGVAEILVDRGEYATIYQSTLTKILFIAFSILLLGLLLTWLLSSTITKPIVELTESAEIISRGDFSCDIQGTDRKDEIGALARAISRMAESIKLAMVRFRK